MFTSNDTDYCPVTYKRAVMSDDDVENALLPDSTETENIYEYYDNIKVYSKDPGTYNYFVQGYTSADKYANQPGVLINNCVVDSQVIFPVTEDPLFLEVRKNQGTIELVSASDLLALFF